jgi:uncharacterized protein (TIGR03067 family)
MSDSPLPVLRPWARALAVLAMGAAMIRPAASASPPSPVEGTWRVVSVEVGGQPVPGLDGAELTMTGGKKTFKLPSGTAEKGTYTLNPGPRPGDIDTTTDGKAGTQKGIYTVDGETLKLCLSQGGKTRPTELATGQDPDLILIVLRRAPAAPPTSESPAAQKLTGRRHFRMGFTGFVHDITPEAVAASRGFVRDNGDILAHHIEGVPWAESLGDLPFSGPLQEEWEGKKTATPPRGKVYLAISPGRGDLKVADKSMPLPDELKGKSYTDPAVKKAYLAYCRRAIAFFRPDYLAIGIEVNEIHDAGEDRWLAYADLHRHVYAALKKEHKDLPIFASFTLHNMHKRRGGMLAGFRDLMPFNDLVAVSYYPFFMPDADRLSALDWLTREFDAFAKPYAMVETNDAAERLPLPEAKVVIEGTEAKQLAYYETLLALAQRRKFAFVVSFIHRDYDALWEKIKGSSPELFIAWRDCGLQDEAGKPRPAYRVWREYFALPLGD